MPTPRFATPQALSETLLGFRDFSELPEELTGELFEKALVVAVEADQVLATQGSPCKVFPMVLSGRARIFTMDPEGREVTLYRLDPGDGCVLAAMCSLSNAPLPGSVVVERSGNGLFVPTEVFQDWVETYPFWRAYVFSLVARQLGQLVAITNDLAFRRLDTRIAGFLVRRAKGEQKVRATHQAIASEIGTRREVVSRILKDLERSGVLALGRGVVKILDPPGLAALADPLPQPISPDTIPFGPPGRQLT